MATQKQPWKPAGERMAEAIEDGSYALTRAAVEGTTVTLFERGPSSVSPMREVALADVKWPGGKLETGDKHISLYGGTPCTYVAYYRIREPHCIFRVVIQGPLTAKELDRVIEAYKMLLELKGGP